MKIFWSWQSDTHRKTNQYFVRDALDEAIQGLKDANIEEPETREILDNLHLDQDTQGIAGSPNIAQTIFSKIDASTVFVADVTPVSTIPEHTDGDRVILEKRNINPNVAIELGWALKSLNDNHVLMVLNTFYGERKHMPFDLAHKRGPIEYHLPPDADNVKIKTEKKNLKDKLVLALRPYIGKVAMPQKTESLLERAARQRREMDLEDSRKKFLTSPEGVGSALKEIDSLFKFVYDKSQQTNFSMQTNLFNRNTLLLMYEKIGMSIEWRYFYTNTLDKAHLELALWDGSPPHVGMRFEEPSRIGYQKYEFDTNGQNELGWRTGTGSTKLITTEELSEECLKFLFDKVHERATAKSRRNT